MAKRTSGNKLINAYFIFFPCNQVPDVGTMPPEQDYDHNHDTADIVSRLLQKDGKDR